MINKKLPEITEKSFICLKSGTSGYRYDPNKNVVRVQSKFNTLEKEVHFSMRFFKILIKVE